jgi:hypothetical protein
MRKFAVARLVLATLLFGGWVGWLAYLAATASRPIVLSRPQFLVSNLDVVAEVPGPDGPVVVKEVLSRGENVLAPAPGSTIRVDNLKEAWASIPAEWQGRGRYILPLERQDRGWWLWTESSYRVVAIPGSPGHRLPGPPLIYPETVETLTRFQQIKTGTIR